MSDYWKKRLEELNIETKEPSKKTTKSSSSYWQDRLDGFESENKKPTVTYSKDDIAPVAKKEEKERKWFQKGAFEDGYQFGDITRTILGTGTDTKENFTSGILGMGEKVVDAAAQLGAWSYGGLVPDGRGGWTATENFVEDREKAKQEAAEFVKKDLYDEEQIAKQLISDPAKKNFGIDAETHSVLGEKSDSLVQSAGQLAATAGLNAVGLPWWVTTGLTSYGGELENAYNQGATFEEAGMSAAITAGVEILTEKISGGIKFGGKALDDVVTKQIARGVSDKTVRTLLKLGVDASGEGFEEVLSGTMSAIGQKLTYADDKELTELFSSEEALESFIGGFVLGGGNSGFNAIKSNGGADYVTGLTANEQAVVDKEYKDRVAEAEENGKISEREKSKIYDQVLKDMDSGFISTDTIESVLGGETYKAHTDTLAKEKAMQEEYDTLYKMKNGEKSDEQIDRQAELKKQLEDIKQNFNRNQLGEEVFGLVRGDRLVESYNERGRKQQAFEADLSKYDSKYHDTIKKAAESGILNNTNRTHQFVDMIAKISADKGVLFDFTNNAKLKESGFAVDGASVNGFVTKNGITLNIDSAKAWQSTVGHEITHVLEGTEVYDVFKQTIFDYAKSKGEYQSRYDALAKLYENVEDADIDAELTADLVGDYLFQDSDFINKLSTEHRNVFQKIYDEIKYLCKVATAGSKEARELEKVKKAFDKAYQESGNEKPTGDKDIRFSLSEPVEQTDRLVAVHNKSVRGVMRMLERDGVPFASIAIKKAGTPHEGFGECSVVFPRSTIDPEANKWNKLYSNDAWTPTEPRTEYDVGDTYKIQTLFENMVGTDVYNALKGSSVLDSDELAKEIGSNNGNVFDAVKRLGVVKYGYLQSIGKRPETGTKQKTLDGFGRYKNGQLVAVFDAVDGEKIRNANYDDTELLQQIADVLNEQFIKQLPANDSVFKSFRAKPIYTADKINIVAIQDAYEKWEAAGKTIPTEVDYYSLDRALRDNRALEEDADYQRWVEDIFDGIIKDSGIPNGKEIFTPSGNRRSFKALHVPATLENIVQQMRKENETGVGTLGGINLRGAATKTYDTVEDMRKDSGKLLGTRIEDDVYDSYMNGFYNRLNELKNRAAKHDSWSSRDTAEQVLLEAVRDAKTKASMNTMLRKEAEWIKYDAALADDLWQLKQDVQDMPAPYFEAKPRRIVSPYEAAAYIVPDNAPENLFAELDRRGLHYKTYKAGDEADRLSKLNSLLEEQPDLKFSLSNVGEQSKRYGNFATLARELRLEEEIAPVQETTENILHDDHAFDTLVKSDADGDIAPIAAPAAPVKEAYEAIRPKVEKQPRMAKATPAEQARAQVLSEEPETAKQKTSAWQMVKDKVFDKGMVFEDLSLATGNRELQARWNSIRYADGMADRFMEKGNASVSSLKSIQQEVENSGKTQQFYEYLYHLHNADRMTLENRYEDTTNKPVFGDLVTAEMSQETARELEKANPEFKDYAKDVYDYMTHLREMLVDGGVISNETAKLWAEMYPHYVPIRRVGDNGLNINVPLDTGRTGVNAPIKRATGGNRDILPLFDTMAQRTIQTYKAIAKNRFGVELKNILGTTIEKDATGIDEVIDSIDAQDGLLQEGKDGRNPTFTVFENGEKVTFEITEEMYDAMKPKSKAMSYTNKVLNTANNIRRGLLTEYNPTFMLTNPIKDTQDVLLNSQHPAKTYANYPKAIAELLGKKGHWYQEYMEHGGEQNTYFDRETNTFKKEKSGIAKAVGFPLEKISEANNFIERIPRMAEYIASRKAGRSIDVSMLDAARVTTNFAAGGDLTRFLNRNGATFLNASVQGAVQQVRNIREAKANGLRGWAQLAAKVAIAGLPSMLLNHLLWDDDEEYAELSDYVKQNYYIVGKFGDGQFVRIPKGRALAVIQSAFQQMENAVTGNDEVDLRTFGELVISNLAPNDPIESNILAPIFQAKNNETWYGEDLVPTRLQDLPAAEQYDESTDNISKWLGEKLNVSPYKVNYLLDQYSGGLGDTFLPMLTPEAESGDNSFLGNMIAPLKDKFTTDAVMNNQNVSDFYSTVDELTANAKSSKATDEDVLKYKYMNSVNAELSELYARKREIQNSDLSDETKYAQVRSIQQQIDDLTEDSLNTYNDVSIEDGYATVGDRHYRLDDDGTWQKLTDKQLEKQEEVTDYLGIDAPEYWSNKEEYDYAYEYPEKYAVAKSVGGYQAYKQYSDELYDIKADKDENGKSINGSRKEKVIEYINNLDADYGEKIILFKNEYNADDTYNYEIIDYLNGREDISYEEMETILKKLGFTVDSDGNISW